MFKPCPSEGQPMFSSSKGLLFFLVALTSLNKENGLFCFLEGSHKQARNTPQEKWNLQQVTLLPGDAILWRPDLALMPSDGGGGKFLRADFKIEGLT